MEADEKRNRILYPSLIILDNKFDLNRILGRKIIKADFSMIVENQPYFVREMVVK
jgi:hypothetical protein